MGGSSKRSSVDRDIMQVAVGVCLPMCLCVWNNLNMEKNKDLDQGSSDHRGSGGQGQKLTANKAQQSRAAELKVENGGDREGSVGAEHGLLLIFELLAGKLRNKQRPLRQDLCSSEVTCIGRRHVCAPKRGSHAVCQHAIHFSIIQGGKRCAILIW